MRPLEALIATDEPAIGLIHDWIAKSEVACKLLPPSTNRANVLTGVQVTTRSTLGAIVYYTGGILLERGWLRFLGSGSERLPRDLHGWNKGRGDGFFLVADDAAGGFFALNGGAFGPELNRVFYWPPDALGWQALGVGFTDFFRFCLTSRLEDFYERLRWSGWESDVATLPGDRTFIFYPFLWTSEGSLEGSQRASVPATEAFDLKLDIVRQLAEKEPPK